MRVSEIIADQQKSANSNVIKDIWGGLIYNVKVFGAKGDGITDDTASIQAAINAIPDAGGILFFPAGYFKITSELLIDLPVNSGGLMIVGCGKNASLIMPFSPTQHGFHVKSYEPVSFRDIGVYSSVVKTAGAGIYVEGPSSDATKENLNSLYDNVSVGSQYRGIQFAEAAYWSIRGCRIGEYIDSGIYIENTTNVDEGDSNISDTLIIEKDSTSVYGIYYKSSGGLKMNNLKILGGQYGFKMNIADGATTVILLFAGCSIENCTTRCIQLTRTGTGEFYWVVIDGCQLSNADILIDIPSGGIKKFIISDNVLNIKPTGTGVQVIDATGGVISGNEFVGNGSGNSAMAFGGATQAIVDKTNQFTNVTSYMYNAATTSVTAESYNAGAPGNGTWRAGDRVIHPSPTELGTAGSKYIITGWLCTVSGSPGTWLPMRSLTGN